MAFIFEKLRLYFYSTLKIKSVFQKYFISEGEDEDRQFYLLAYTLAFMQLRYTSFCLEKCRAKATTPYGEVCNAPPLSQGEKLTLEKENFSLDDSNSTKAVTQTYEKDEQIPLEDFQYMERPKNEQEELAAQVDINTADNKQKTDHFSFLHLLYYAFYFPLFFTGPVMTYDMFQKQVGYFSSFENLEFFNFFSQNLVTFIFLLAPFILDKLILKVRYL